MKKVILIMFSLLVFVGCGFEQTSKDTPSLKTSAKSQTSNVDPTATNDICVTPEQKKAKKACKNFDIWGGAFAVACAEIAGRTVYGTCWTVTEYQATWNSTSCICSYKTKEVIVCDCPRQS